jgi:hypothetical protein
MNDYLYFNNRSNYDTFAFNGKRIILYDDHRSILNVLFFGRENGLLAAVPNIVTFDYHDDAISPSEEQLNRIIKFKTTKPSIEEFWGFVEFKLRALDDDWITTGFEFELINHVVNIGAEDYPNIGNETNKIYKDHNGINHEIHLLSHFDSSLSERGILGDFMKNDERVREILQFNIDNSFNFGDQDVYPYILDFDLDCFSCKCVDRIIAWPESIFIRKYVQDRKSYRFLSSLIRRSNVITICQEPNCCGGLGESYKILSYLDKYFFDNALGTEIKN